MDFILMVSAVVVGLFIAKYIENVLWFFKRLNAERRAAQEYYRSKNG